MSPRTRGRSSTRGYAVTRWGRAFVDVVEGARDGDADLRRITQARRYFRDHHAEAVRIVGGTVTASVRGSQLDPFDVTLTMRPVDPATVIALLRSRDAIGDLMALTRGDQPAALGALILPTESADIAADCTCPDSSTRCIHVLCVAYEVAAQIDRDATTLLTVMGTDTAELLASASDHATDVTSSVEPGEPAQRDEVPAVDFYGTNAVLPPLPSPPRLNPIMELDPAALRKALRASGIAPADIGEAVDLLDELYERLRDREEPNR
ncbi:hypothetical protein VZC37_20410 [Gordonia sp. LSe1-13]|uniref:SWIM-type domain-containing protein n=1 Tax=Gordonia sesuvii TaxID=3116777 RepID=A0ABU7MHY4_9ACTN|nr:hypothetical protein [Gordonia sp. LSe1-13]